MAYVCARHPLSDGTARGNGSVQSSYWPLSNEHPLPRPLDYCIVLARAAHVSRARNHCQSRRRLMDDLVIVGGGPSGLAAAHEAVGRGAKAVVLERLPVVGGLSRTTAFEGSRFDVGPHRFFTKNQEVHRLFV